MDTYASLVAAGQRKIAASSPAGVVVDHPSPAHAAIAGALDELLGLVTAAAGNLPAPARAMLGLIQASRPQMLDGLAKIPEEQLLTVLRQFAGKIAAVPGVVPSVVVS